MPRSQEKRAQVVRGPGKSTGVLKGLPGSQKYVSHGFRLVATALELPEVLCEDICLKSYGDSNYGLGCIP